MNKTDTWVIGDIHGEHDKLVDLLQLIKFDYDNDTLIQLGDVIDRGPSSYECVEELLKIKNLIAIKGNHDDCWFKAYVMQEENILYNQGGLQTDMSFENNCHEKDGYPGYEIPQTHFEFFSNQKLWHLDKEGRFFVHGGFDRHKFVSEQEEDVFLWDRDLFLAALSHKDMSGNFPFKTKDNFKEIFIGHTPTVYWKNKLSGKPITIPMRAGNIWNIDTGCGKGNFPLTAMNIDTREYYQSK